MRHKKLAMIQIYSDFALEQVRDAYEKRVDKNFM